MASVPYATTNTIANVVPGPTATLGYATTDLVGFYGSAGTARRASANQAALTIVAYGGTAYGYGYGFSTYASIATLVATVNEIVATLTALGAWKGSA